MLGAMAPWRGAGRRPTPGPSVGHHEIRRFLRRPRAWQKAAWLEWSWVDWLHCGLLLTPQSLRLACTPLFCWGPGSRHSGGR